MLESFEAINVFAKNNKLFFRPSRVLLVKKTKFHQIHVDYKHLIKFLKVNHAAKFSTDCTKE